MASNLVELAREVGGDELAERVERLKGEVKEVEQLIEAEQVEGVIRNRLERKSALPELNGGQADLQSAALPG